MWITGKIRIIRGLGRFLYACSFREAKFLEFKQKKKFTCFLVQSCQQSDAEGEAKQKALQHDQNSAA